MKVVLAGSILAVEAVEVAAVSRARASGLEGEVRMQASKKVLTDHAFLR